MRKQKLSERFWAIGIVVTLILAVGSGVYVVSDLRGSHHRYGGQ